MKKTMKLTSLILAGAMALSMTGCSSKPAETTAAATAEATTVAAETTATADTTAAAAEGETYKIGVLQLVQHSALDASNEGFFAALDDAGIKYEADQQNASGEQVNCMTIAEKLVNDGNDLI
ncbi:MAG: ABC transporter substrate-binding protein, partial [Lachnospiraceae bacterium]|nr:ABC transporter substrate-binding protein [Lachnospiraceae bacterium]